MRILTIGETMGETRNDDVGARLYAERGERYGPAEVNMARTGIIWQAILGLDAPVAPERVALCLIGVKLARLVHTPDDEDSISDLSGYAAVLRALGRSGGDVS